VELAVLGAGQVVGELALVDGGTRAATVRALEATAALFFSRADFLALASRLDPTAVALKRRLAAIVCGRLRNRLEVLSGSLDEHDAAPEVPADELVCGSRTGRALSRAVAVLPRLRAPLQLPGLLAACRTLEGSCLPPAAPRRRTFPTSRT